ncbi:391_t:CDS:2, partial [Racocetra persica]
LINNSKILDTTFNIPANQVQPIFTQFAPNLESIQNAFKYNKKSYYLICSLIDNYKVKGTVISKQYSVIDIQDSKEQAVLLGVVSTIVLVLLTKYPDFLEIDSTGHHNGLNFPNIVFMIRLNKLCGQVVAIFINDKETIPVVNLMFEQTTLIDTKKLQVTTGIANLVIAETI